MKKWIKVLIGVIVTSILLIGILFVIYVLVNQQGVIESNQVGNPNAETKVLIASQGSNFKAKLVEKIVKEYKNKNYYFSIIDCTKLDHKKDRDWDMVIIIHTMQMHQMPKEAKVFLSDINDLSNIMLVSTSGGGDDMVQGFDVDAISSPSRDGKIPKIMEWISKNMDDKLQNEVIATAID